LLLFFVKVLSLGYGLFGFFRRHQPPVLAYSDSDYFPIYTAIIQQMLLQRYPALLMVRLGIYLACASPYV
jgi:hypothetical protein